MRRGQAVRLGVEGDPSPAYGLIGVYNGRVSNGLLAHPGRLSGPRLLPKTIGEEFLLLGFSHFPGKNSRLDGVLASDQGLDLVLEHILFGLQIKQGHEVRIASSKLRV